MDGQPANRCCPFCSATMEAQAVGCSACKRFSRPPEQKSEQATFNPIAYINTKLARWEERNHLFIVRVIKIIQISPFLSILKRKILSLFLVAYSIFLTQISPSELGLANILTLTNFWIVASAFFFWPEFRKTGYGEPLTPRKKENGPSIWFLGYAINVAAIQIIALLIGFLYLESGYLFDSWYVMLAVIAFVVPLWPTS